jgi:hypothetical protein
VSNNVTVSSSGQQRVKYNKSKAQYKTFKLAFNEARLGGI